VLEDRHEVLPDTGERAAREEALDDQEPVATVAFDLRGRRRRHPRQSTARQHP
jgi:hypothetical protein